MEFLLLTGVEFLEGQGRNNYPLVLLIDDLGEDFLLTAEVDATVNADLLCSLMQRTLETLITALADAPETPLGALLILSAEEKQQLHVKADSIDTPEIAAPKPRRHSGRL